MRKDVHKPSAIVPEDYEYVAEECMRPEEWQAVKAMREIIAAHRTRTGGQYAQIETTGNCMVCGSVNALYTSLFYHAKSNTYVRMGHDCADKVDMGDEFARKNFRRAVEDARERHAGKQKAIALLSDYGLQAAWDVYTSDLSEFAGRVPWETVTVRDIVGKLVKYGSISEKQQNFVRSLLVKIEQRPLIEAQRETKRAEERASAQDCPEGRVTITGVVVLTKWQESDFGTSLKMLVKSDEGFKVWGSVPSVYEDMKRGAYVRFSANFTRSKDDSQFGFYKRPTKLEVLQEAWERPGFEQIATFEPNSATSNAYAQAYPEVL